MLKKASLFTFNFKNNFVIKVKVVLFIAIFLLGSCLIPAVLMDQNDATLRRKAFDLIPRNSIEIMFIGNSHSYCSFVPTRIEGITGHKTYNASMPSQVLDLVWYNLEYQLRTQHPKIIVLEAFAFQKPTIRDVFNDANIDSMTFNTIKLSAIFDIFRSDKDRFELLTQIYRKHGNWSNMTLVKANLKEITGIHKSNNSDDSAKGYYQLDSEMSEQTALKYKNMNSDEAKYKALVSKYNTKYFTEIVDLCKKRKIKLILTMSPMNQYFISKVNYANTYDSFLKLCSQNNVEYLDYNMLYDEIHLADSDFEDAFHTAQHTNKKGAQKISEHMGKYLKTHEW